MAMLDDEEDQDFEKQLAEAAGETPAAPPAAAGMPPLHGVNDADARAIIRERLLNKMQDYEQGMKDDVRASRDSRRDDSALSRDLALNEALSRSASQIGSIAGQQADTSAVSGITSRLLDSQKQDINMADKQKTERDRLNQYLMGKMLEQNQSMDKLDVAKARTAAETNKEKERQAFIAAENEKNRKNKNELLDKSLAVKEDAADAKLPPEDKATITGLAQKNAAKISIANQMEGYLQQYRDAKSDSAKITMGRQMLKVLNSPEGSDAVGAEEAKRLGGLLEYQIGNLTGPGPMFGRDLKGFDDQVVATINSVRSGVKQNNKMIADIKNKAPVNLEPVPNAVDKPSGAIAAPIGLGARDQQALTWAKMNPNDPRAKAIIQKLGAGGQ